MKTVDCESSAAASGKHAKGEVFSASCPSRQILRELTSKWGTLVLVALMDGELRFSGLRRRISGVSEKMLTQTLQQLESSGFVRREVFPEVPPHVEYSLTPLGKTAAGKVADLVSWIEESLPEIIQVKRAVAAARPSNEDK